MSDECKPVYMNRPWWGLFNWGRLVTIRRTRRECVMEAIVHDTARDWRRDYDVRKLRVTLWDAQKGGVKP